MATIALPFSEEVYGFILKEARKKNVRPETLLKIWILERAKMESVDSHEPNDPLIDAIALPLKIGMILTASATATVTTLAKELTV